MSHEQLIDELLSLAAGNDKDEARMEGEALLLEYIGDGEIRSAFREIWKMA